MQLQDLYEGMRITQFFSLNGITPETEVVCVDDEFGRGGLSNVKKYIVGGKERIIHLRRSMVWGLGPAHLTKTDLEVLATVENFVETEAVAVYLCDGFPHPGIAYGMLIQKEAFGVPLDSAELPHLTYSQIFDCFADVIGTIIKFGKLGYVHRDVKPGNILIPFDKSERRVIPYRNATLIDFGAVTRHGEMPEIRNCGFGTLRYSSPEQVVAEYLDYKSDIYSWGITLAEALNLPGCSVRGLSQRTIHGIVSRGNQIPTFQRLKYIPKPLQPDVEAIFVSALAKDKNRRDHREITERLDNAKKIAIRESF